jgi:MOSC domain-containing protein YiiM
MTVVVLIGEVRLETHGESKPCELMDELRRGLRKVLVPHARGGAYGQVLVGGTIRIGDGIMIE